MVIIFFLYLIAYEQKGSRYERRAERLVSRYGDTGIHIFICNLSRHTGPASVLTTLIISTPIHLPNFLATLRSLRSVLPYKLHQERRAVFDALVWLAPCFAEPPIDGLCKRGLTAQTAAPGQDGGPVKPYAVANLLDFLRVNYVPHRQYGSLVQSSLTLYDLHW
jgi:hypothetical protein